MNKYKIMISSVALGLGICSSAMAIVSDQSYRHLYIQNNDNNVFVENCVTFSSPKALNGKKFNAESSTCTTDNSLNTGDQCVAVYKPDRDGIITCEVNHKERDKDGNPIHEARLEIIQKSKGTLVNFYPWDENTDIQTGFIIKSPSQGGFYNPSREDTISIQST